MVGFGGTARLVRATFLLAGFALNAFAEVGKSPQKLLAEFKDYRFYSYLAPNEDQPAQLLPILAAAPRGAYFSVGSERGFIGASLTDAITHLVLVDRDPSVVLFNQLNTALLMVSKNLRDYRHLRFKAPLAEWRARSRGLPRRVRRLLSDPHAAGFWLKRVRNPEFRYNDADFRTLYRDPRKQPGLEFAQANYLFYPEQFKRLQRLAKQGEISVYQVDLTLSEEVQRFWGDLEHSGVSIGVFDLSNVPDLLTKEQMGDLIVRLGWIAEPGALVISTHFAYGRQLLYHGHRLDLLLGSARTASPARMGDLYARSRQRALRWATPPLVREVVSVLEEEWLGSASQCLNLLK